MKTFLFIISLLLATIDGSSPLFSAEEEPYIIPIYPQQPVIGDRPRTPEAAPFSAYADTDAEELILWANSNCGIICISGYNSTSGSTFSAQSTSLGSGDSFSYPVFWTSGTWTLTFTLESGNAYYGQIML